MLGYIRLGIGLALAALLTYTHIYAYNAGKASVLSRLQSGRIEVLKDGKKIDEKALGADDSALCDLLGGCLHDYGTD